MMEDGRILISDLLAACRQLEEEYGADGHIIIQMRDDTGEFISGDYCYGFTSDSDGNLYLTNNPPRIGEYLN